MEDLESMPLAAASPGSEQGTPAAPQRTAAALLAEADQLRNQGRLAEALERYDAAVRTEPQCAAAHLGRGSILLASAHFEAAENACRQALACEPRSAAAHFNLGILAMYRGKYPDALPLLARALAQGGDAAARAAFASCAARTHFTSDDPLVRAMLATAIAEAWGLPHDLCAAAVSLLLLEAPVAGCVRRAEEHWPARLPPGLLYGEGGLAALAANRLLHAVLAAVPVKSVRFERFLTGARHALLEAAAADGDASDSDTAALPFYAALAQQCFINEYIFDFTAAEQQAAAECRVRLEAMLDAGAAVPQLLLLAVAACSPLRELRGAQRLTAVAGPTPVGAVLRQQLREPLEEEALRAGMARLTPLGGGVSAVVRAQYEENPYPRWVSMPLRERPVPFNAELRRTLPFAHFAPLAAEHGPEVLVAGCGTGADAIAVARRFHGARVLAVDLSLASLAYAQRKTRELGVTNIEYAQADILELGGLERSFDVVSAIGVLHHLADPLEGWRILISRLRPGGCMCLGLYSRIARRAVVRAREFIAARGYAATAEDIRRFRQDALGAHASAEVKSLARSYAFYSMSDCRDLAFHVAERQLTLAEIAAFLGAADLRFLGFELDPHVLGQYRARFGQDPSCTDLRNWAAFEADHPDTFTGMYRFWIQR
jgi:2-polyprenyl-3-methyl-5-hydroxy-6-metoxy-1,4-benzoquinol methylase/tetratricopeptide (TPR) repeat protein